MKGTPDPIAPVDPVDFCASRACLWLKRVVDVVFSVAALVALLPLMGLIALAIRLDSPGPVIFTQTRVGRNRRRREQGRPAKSGERRVERRFGREFRMYKFRTMRCDTPEFSISPSDTDDPRITSMGRFLRKTSLDELPQLINVLKGDMSLIGPRPEMPFIVATYDPIHQSRLAVRPGITGPWQLHGPRDRAIHEAIEWDLDYVKNWSLQHDFGILLKTLVFVFQARNR